MLMTQKLKLPDVSRTLKEKVLNKREEQKQFRFIKICILVPRKVFIYVQTKFVTSL